MYEIAEGLLVWSPLSGFAGLGLALGIVMAAATAAHAMSRVGAARVAPATGSAVDRALDHVRRRMASGEITPEEYARIAEVLVS